MYRSSSDVQIILKSIIQEEAYLFMWMIKQLKCSEFLQKLPYKTVLPGWKPKARRSLNNTSWVLVSKAPVIPWKSDMKIEYNELLEEK